MPIAREILDMLDLGRKAIASNFSCFFTSKIQKSQRKVFLLCNGFRLFLSMAIDGPITKNHRSVGTPLYIHILFIPYCREYVNKDLYCLAIRIFFFFKQFYYPD